jgi:predicted DCC family thiol-disulfide oxidoreductase YuxK
MTAVSPDRVSIGETSPLVLFDGVCNLCSWSVQFLAPRDKRHLLWYAAVQSQAGQELLQRHGLPTGEYESFILLENGRIYAKSQAFFRVARYMGFPWTFLRAGLMLPRGFADWLYDRVANNRYAIFGKKDTCMIPRKDISQRFLG